MSRFHLSLGVPFVTRRAVALTFLAVLLGSCADDPLAVQDASRTAPEATAQAASSASAGANLIRSCADLQRMDQNLNKKFRLANDIDCAGVAFLPIGTDGARPFRGELDGDGHVIRNLRIARSGVSGVGLFAAVDHATIRDLGVVNADVRGKGRVGVLAGHADESEIEKCYVTGRVEGSTADVGGVVGWLEHSEIEDSYSRVDVRGPSGRTGLLAGTAERSSVEHLWAAGHLVGGVGNWGRVISPRRNDALFDCTIDSTCATGNPEARTTAELQHPREFDSLDYDLDEVWGFRAWSTYACLREESGCGDPPQACNDHCDCGDEHGHHDRGHHRGHRGHGSHCAPVVDAGTPGATSCGVGVCARTGGGGACIDGWLDADSCTPGLPTGDDSTCNGADDDCDGQVDEAFVGSTTSCGTGVCSATGTSTCVAGQVINSCTAGLPTGNDATCNGIDDDCDGSIDEAYVATPTTCGIGACAATGSTACVSGAVTSSCTAGSPSGNDSACNGIDDDCDGSVDEAYASTATSCGLGVCAAAGTTTCTGGVVHDSCVVGPAAGPDTTCDSRDDNCDGSVDEGFVPTSTTCGVGACGATGTTSCSAGVVRDSCTAGAPTGNDASCDGLDDDCDGSVDEAYVVNNTTCGVGVCTATGSTSCIAGGVVDSCTVGAPTGDDSVCNALDDDCDGSVDEAYVVASTTCGVGVCAASGATSCVAGTVTDSCSVGAPTGNDSTCDGLDDNCDGSVDEAYVAMSTSCGLGVCAASGTTSCVAGAVVNSCSAGSPTGDDSVCDGLDNNCNGSVDEGYVSTSTNCGVGACAATGASSCISGSVVDSCSAGSATGNDSSCNGIDDDCDGSVDEAYASTATSCGVGVCAAAGATSCVSGAMHDSCGTGAATGSDSVCNGLDDDCDGSVDEAYIATTTSCGVGVCAASGSTSCVDGSLHDSCSAGASTGSDANCDGLDNDCDGSTDESYASTATSCGVGVCAASGATSCVAGAVHDSCSVGAPTGNDSVCNGLDDNCNGSVDEAFVATTTSCGVGVCAAAGATSCVAGTVQNSCAVGAPTGNDSTCDGLDNNCDGSVDEAYVSTPTSCGVGVCAATGGTACVSGAVASTCAPLASTGNDSVCNGLDDDCDGSVDESFSATATNCGVGACAAVGSTTCVAGSVGNSCIAGAPLGVDSTCDGIDDNCNGTADEAFGTSSTTCGLGPCMSSGTLTCVSGHASNTCVAGTPAASDVSCNGVDDNCNGTVDEGCCIPRTCVDVGAGCGTADDGCGHPLNCGGCNTDETCTTAAGGTRVCAPTTPIADPVAIAPNAAGSVDLGFFDAYSFLVGGVIRDFDASQFEPHRAALVRGLVLDTTGAPLANVRVSVKDHPELGHTFTRADGAYDLLAEGGGLTVIEFAASLYLPVQRAIALDWETGNALDTVVLTPESPISTSIAFGSSTPQIAMGGVVTDSDGARAISVFVPAGVTATVAQNGTTVPFNGGHLRLTEFTVGPNGRLAMPGELTGNAAYTFAANFGFDEARDGTVQFSQPVVTYVDEFLGFPPGALVPAAYYDGATAAWIPVDDGIVIAIDSIDASGLAVLRVSATPGVVASASILAELGVTDAERRALAEHHVAGSILWRVRATHFSKYDYNISSGRRTLPPKAGGAPTAAPVAGACSTEAKGSIVLCDARGLDERFEVAGAPFALRYSSSKVNASTAPARTIRVPINIPETNVISVHVRVEVLGRVIADETVAGSASEYVATWDGRDAYGRPWTGVTTAFVELDRTVPVSYAIDVAGGRVTYDGSLRFSGARCNIGTDLCCGTTVAAPAGMGRLNILNSGNRSALIRDRLQFSVASAVSAEPIGLGGLFPESMHRYDPQSRTLYTGDGSTVALRDRAIDESIIAGGASDNVTTTLTAVTTNARAGSDLQSPTSLAAAPDGSIYFIQSGGSPSKGEIWRLSVEGHLDPMFAYQRTPEAVARYNSAVGNAPAFTSFGFTQLEVAPDGALYALDNGYRVVRFRNVGTTNVSVESLTGGNNAGLPGWIDGAVAKTSRFNGIGRIAFRDDGVLHILTNGVYSLPTGGSTSRASLLEYLPDGTLRELHTWLGGSRPQVMAPGLDGSIILAGVTGGQLLRYDMDGTLRNLTAGGTTSIGVTSVPPGGERAADGLNFASAAEIHVRPDGSIYTVHLNGSGGSVWEGIVATGTNGRTRRVILPIDTMPTLFVPNGSFSGRTNLGVARSIAFRPNGRMFAAETGLDRILEHDTSVGDTMATYAIVSPNGHDVFHFNRNGKHLATTDAESGAIQLQFAYDDGGRLTAVVDTDGQITDVERPDAATIVVRSPAGVGPGAERVATILHLDATGYVSEITDPRGAQWALDYTTGGLIHHLWNPRQNESGLRSGTPFAFEFDAPTTPQAAPLLASDTNPLGDSQTLSSTNSHVIAPTYSTWCDGSSYQSGWRVSSATTHVTRSTNAGETTQYDLVLTQTTGAVVRTTTHPSGTTTSTTFVDQIGRIGSSSPEVSVTSTLTPDPWLGSAARYARTSTVVVAAAAGAPARTRVTTTARSADVSPSDLVPQGMISRNEVTTVVAGTAASAQTRTITTHYDASTRTTTVTSGLGRSSSEMDDANGRTTYVNAPGQLPVHYVYDTQGYLTAIERSGVGRTRRVDMTYDGRGYLASSTTRIDAARSTTVSYPANDALGFPTQASIAGIGTVGARPGIDGAVEGVTPPDQAEHTFRSDVLGRATAYAPAGITPPTDATSCPAGVQCTEFDRASRPTVVRHEDGTSTNIAYNAARGLVASVAVPGDGTYGFTYDTVGRPSAVTAPDGGQVAFTWQASWPITETYSGTHTVRDGVSGPVAWSGTLNAVIRRTYNDFLELETASVDNGYAMRFGRDGDGLLTSIAPVTAGAAPTLTLVRDALDGRVTAMTDGVVNVAYSHDINATNPGFGDLLGQTVTANSATVYASSYGYDDAGRIVTWTESNGGATSTRHFDYDDAGRLVGVRNATNALVAEFGFDANGNRTRVLDTRPGPGAQDVELGANLGCTEATTGTPLSRAANAQDQLCRYGDYTYTYDANGRLASRANAATGQTLTLRYDAAGRLHEATGENGMHVNYVNDAQGRRMARIVNGTLERGWVYGGALAPIAEIGPTGAVVATYVYASHGNVPDLIVKSGVTYRVITDHLGSARAVVNASTGSVVHRMDFDEWGNLVAESGDSTLHPFGYAGGILDRTTGLTRFGARDYDPVAGRWTSKDPIGFEAGSPNLYSYVENAPVALVDPQGLWIEIAPSAPISYQTALEIVVLSTSIGAGIGAVLGGIGGGVGGTLASAPTGPFAAMGGAVGASSGVASGAAVGATAGAAFGTALAGYLLESRGGRGRGERNQTRPGGQNNPWKHTRQDPRNQDRILQRHNQTHQWVSKPKPEGWDAWNAGGRGNVGCP